MESGDVLRPPSFRVSTDISEGLDIVSDGSVFWGHQSL